MFELLDFSPLCIFNNFFGGTIAAPASVRVKVTVKSYELKLCNMGWPAAAFHKQLNLNEFFYSDDIDVKQGDEVELLLYKMSDLGMNAIVDNLYKGLIFKFNTIFEKFGVIEIFLHWYRSLFISQNFAQFKLEKCGRISYFS